jgi:hypothetical protein
MWLSLRTAPCPQALRSARDAWHAHGPSSEETPPQTDPNQAEPYKDSEPPLASRLLHRQQALRSARDALRAHGPLSEETTVLISEIKKKKSKPLLMGQHKDAASFTAVTQNLRGLTTEKLEIIIKNMEGKAIDITVLQETWKATPTGVAIEELGNAANLAARRTAASCHREPKRDQCTAKGRYPKDQSRKLINTFCGAP